MCSGKNFGKASTSCKGSVTMGWEVLQQSLKLSTSHHLSHNPHPHPVPKTPRGPLCKDLKNILISTPRTTEGPTETKCLPAPVSCLYQDSHICVGSIGDPFAPPPRGAYALPPGLPGLPGSSQWDESLWSRCSAISPAGPWSPWLAVAALQRSHTPRQAGLVPGRLADPSALPRLSKMTDSLWKE